MYVINRVIRAISRSLIQLELKLHRRTGDVLRRESYVLGRIASDDRRRVIATRAYAALSGNGTPNGDAHLKLERRRDVFLDLLIEALFGIVGQFEG